jgi:hypothetical protein
MLKDVTSDFVPRIVPSQSLVEQNMRSALIGTALRSQKLCRNYVELSGWFFTFHYVYQTRSREHQKWGALWLVYQWWRMRCQSVEFVWALRKWKTCARFLVRKPERKNTFATRWHMWVGIWVLKCTSRRRICGFVLTQKGELSSSVVLTHIETSLSGRGGLFFNFLIGFLVIFFRNIIMFQKIEMCS